MAKIKLLVLLLAGLHMGCYRSYLTSGAVEYDMKETCFRFTTIYFEVGNFPPMMNCSTSIETRDSVFIMGEVLHDGVFYEERLKQGVYFFSCRLEGSLLEGKFIVKDTIAISDSVGKFELRISRNDYLILHSDEGSFYEIYDKRLVRKIKISNLKLFGGHLL